MKHPFLLLFILLSIGTFGQTKPCFQTEKNVIGKFYDNDSSIFGTQYQFNDYIFDYDLDTLNNTVLVQLRGTKRDKYWENEGIVCQINLQLEKTYWKKEINYQQQYFHQFGNYIFSGDGKSSTLHHSQLGSKRWTTDVSFCYVNDKNQIGVGYNNQEEGQHLYGIDLQNNEKKWDRQIVRDFGWDEIRYLNDSTLLIVANGLHAINLLDGKGWDVNLVSGSQSYGKAAAGALGGVALGILTGFYYIPKGDATVTKGMISNTLIDRSYIYIASKNRIVKVDKDNGELVWNHAFEDEECGKSTLLFNDTTIVMIHNGSAQKEGKTIDYAKPFFAAFDRETGNEVFKTKLNTKHSINDYEIIGDSIYLMSENEIVACSLQNGEMLNKKTYSGKAVSPFVYFIGNRFLLNDSEKGYVTFTQSDTTALFVLTNGENILKINSALETEKTFTKNEFSYVRHNIGSLFFIDDNGKTIVFDNNTKSKIAEIDIPFLSFDGYKAIKRDKDKLTIIDLKSIVEMAKKQ